MFREINFDVVIVVVVVVVVVVVSFKRQHSYGVVYLQFYVYWYTASA